MDEVRINIPNTIHVQFTDLEGEDQSLTEVPLRFMPRVGDNLNVRHRGMTYFLRVESFTHFADCDLEDAEQHAITIDCKLLNVWTREEQGA